MLGVLVVTHGRLAAELVLAARKIVGDVDEVLGDDDAHDAGGKAQVGKDHTPVTRAAGVAETPSGPGNNAILSLPYPQASPA